MRPLFQVPSIPCVAVLDALWTGLSVLVFFPATVAIALLLRRRVEVHRRLMLLASISIVGPAVGRLGPLVYASTGVGEIPFNLVFVLGLPLSLVVNDLWTTRRLHAATAWGTTAYVLITVFAGHAMAPTPVGRALFGMLE